jgi:hypothetical protein
VPLSPFIPIATVLSAAYLMNSLPIDTWIRLIDWMAIGLVVYFGYSYNSSHLGKAPTDIENSEVPADYKPPIAALLAVVLAVVLTIYQVLYLMPNTDTLDMAVRLFAWIITGVLVAVLMYGKGDRSAGRDPNTRKIGLIASIANLLIWAGITYWFFVHYAELHSKM